MTITPEDFALTLFGCFIIVLLMYVRSLNKEVDFFIKESRLWQQFGERERIEKKDYMEEAMLLDKKCAAAVNALEKLHDNLDNLEAELHQLRVKNIQESAKKEPE